jgi:hypothetical protein
MVGKNWLRRLGRLALALVPASAVLGMIAYAAPASASAGTGWLRLAHLSPNTPAVDVYLYSFHNPKAMVVVHHVAYGTISGFQPVPSGEYTVAMRGAGAKPSSPPVLSTTVNIRPGGAYTVAGMGPYKGLRLQIIKDRLTTPPGKALVRIIQASLTQHRVTVSAGKKVLVSKLPFAQVTSYVAVPAGTWNVAAAGQSEHTASTITLAAGTIHTIVVLDHPGAPATGFGGTAPRPSPSELPWLVVAAGGLLLCAAGVRWATRSHGLHSIGNRRPPAVT